jgi:hypothetical protein
MGARELKATVTALAVAWPLLSFASSHQVTVCLDYGCDYTRSTDIRAHEWRLVEEILSEVDSADAERVALAEAIGELEQIVGGKVGTAEDAPRNATPDTRIIGQLDCIAESINTERYLQLLATSELLRHHRVVGREVRHRWVFDTHWTAVIEEIDSGERFAVDSWHRRNGEPAAIQRLSAWRRADPIDDPPSSSPE